MEQEVKSGNIFSKALGWLKSHIKIVAIVVAVLVLAIILINVFTTGPKKAVKSYIKAMNKSDADKYVDTIDYAGEFAWNYSINKIDKFDEDDYDEFIKAYKEVDKDEAKEAMKTRKEYMEDFFDDIDDDYKSYKIKIVKFKGVEKLGKDLYLVKAKISKKATPEDKDDDEIDTSSIAKFIVYKNKIIYSGI